MKIQRIDIETDVKNNDKIYNAARNALKAVDKSSALWTEADRKEQQASWVAWRTRSRRSKGGSSKRRTRKKKHKIKMSK